MVCDGLGFKIKVFCVILSWAFLAFMFRITKFIKLNFFQEDDYVFMVKTLDHRGNKSLNIENVLIPFEKVKQLETFLLANKSFKNDSVLVLSKDLEIAFTISSDISGNIRSIFLVKNNVDGLGTEYMLLEDEFLDSFIRRVCFFIKTW